MALPKRVVLVDGSWLVFRAFFAIPASFSTKAGLPTNAAYGFATMFRKLFDGKHGKRPDLGAVVFDSQSNAYSDGALVGVRVMVLDDDLDEARALLKEYDA